MAGPLPAGSCERAPRTDRHRGTPPDHSFKKSSAEKIMKAVLEDKMAYTNERDGKG